jgi:hypothetical protein
MLPILAFILLEIHCLSRLKSRGFADYIIRQTLAAIPLIIAIVSLSFFHPIPTEDPEIIPLPMEGLYVPAPEWYFVTFLLPYWYFPPREWTIYLFWIPFLFFLVILALPFFNKRKSKKDLTTIPEKRRKWMSIGYTVTGSLVAGLLLIVLLWGSVESPWKGCNSCHNVSMGIRMGIPPVTYKDTNRNPLLLDKRWMMRHWYEPQVVW